MIPKIIHYCWFGGSPMPTSAQNCINSWKKYCPEYEIKEWNENNFDLNCCDYVKEAYEAKKWAFVTDYVRLFALVTEGGIYMDTDVEAVASIDSYLDNKAFSGFQTETEIPTGIMACEKGYPLFCELLMGYNNRHFKIKDGEYDTSTNVETITNECLKKGLVLNNQEQNIEGFHLYPCEVFCAKDYRTGIVRQTRNTVTIHHFSGSWMPNELKISTKIWEYSKNKGRLIQLAGRVLAFPITFIGRCKLEGVQKSIKHYLRKFHT